MTHHRPTPAPHATTPDPGHDELAASIASALRSREPSALQVAATTEQIAARLAAAEDGSAAVVPFGRRASRVVVTGLVTSTIVAVGAGTAAAAHPYSSFAATVEGVVQAVGVDWSAMPAGYTREQYQAFWDAGFSAEDIDELGALWQTDVTGTKARAGQMILDGEELPFAPGTHAAPEVSSGEQSALDEFWDAGYTTEDVEALNALWNTDTMETKERAGQLLLDGQPVPVEPSGTPTATSSD